MLDKGRWEPLEFEPSGISCLESEEITCFAGIVSAVHVGIEENLEV